MAALVVFVGLLLVPLALTGSSSLEHLIEVPRLALEARSGHHLDRDRDTTGCAEDAGLDEQVCQIGLAAQHSTPSPKGGHGPLSGCGRLVRGDRGPCVVALQQRLRVLGANLPVTGEFQQRTEDEVKIVQRTADPPLPASGIVGVRTQMAIEKAVAAHKKPGARTGSSRGERIAETARAIVAGRSPGQAGREYLPYVWGGGHGGDPGPSTGTCSGYESDIPCEATTTVGVDCSGFTRWVYFLVLGEDVLGPGNTDDQRARTTRVVNPRPGDLVLFGSSSDTHHVAIYLGDGKIAHAPDTGRNIEIGQVDDFVSTAPESGPPGGARKWTPRGVIFSRRSCWLLGRGRGRGP